MDWKSDRQIAEELNVCVRTVARRRKREGVEHPRRERIENAAVMLADGASWREVMRTLNMHRQTLERHFPGTGWSNADGARFGNEKARLERLVERMSA